MYQNDIENIPNSQFGKSVSHLPQEECCGKCKKDKDIDPSLLLMDLIKNLQSKQPHLTSVSIKKNTDGDWIMFTE